MVRVQYGTTPLVVAADNGHLDVVTALIEGRADIEVKADVSSRTFWRQTSKACARSLG